MIKIMGFRMLVIFMNLTVYREFPIRKQLEEFTLKGVVGVTVNIDYSEISDENEESKKSIKINQFNNIEFYQVVLLKDEDDNYRKDILSINDKNIKKYKPEIVKAIKNKFRRTYKFDQIDLLAF